MESAKAPTNIRLRIIFDRDLNHLTENCQLVGEGIIKREPIKEWISLRMESSTIPDFSTQDIGSLSFNDCIAPATVVYNFRENHMSGSTVSGRNQA